MSLNCVWLRTLNASARNWIARVLPIRKFLNSARSQLLMPGRRTALRGALPMSPRPAGRLNAAALNQPVSGSRSLKSFGSPVMFGRT